MSGNQGKPIISLPFEGVTCLKLCFLKKTSKSCFFLLERWINLPNLPNCNQFKVISCLVQVSQFYLLSVNNRLSHCFEILGLYDINNLFPLRTFKWKQERLLTISALNWKGFFDSWPVVLLDFYTQICVMQIRFTVRHSFCNTRPQRTL